MNAWKVRHYLGCGFTALAMAVVAPVGLFMLLALCVGLILGPCELDWAKRQVGEDKNRIEKLVRSHTEPARLFIASHIEKAGVPPTEDEIPPSLLETPDGSFRYQRSDSTCSLAIGKYEADGMVIIWSCSTLDVKGSWYVDT